MGLWGKSDWKCEKKIKYWRGCEYLYLFAADNSNEIETVISEPIMYTKDYYDSYEDDKPEEEKKDVGWWSIIKKN